MVLTRHLEKVLLQEKSRAEDVESEPPEIGAEDQPAPGDAVDDNGTGGGEEENFEESRSESFSDPPTGGPDDGGSDRGEKENSDDGRSQSLRDDNGSDGGSQSLSDAGSSYSDEEEEEEVEPMRPLRMYFPPTEYNKKMKLSTRCYLDDMFETFRKLNPPLTDREKRWFETHPQFKHIFHMPRDKNHKLQGMWMLLLRTACTEKKKEVWFVVNGVPIRYGLREHALISGLYCHNYPLGYDNKSGAMSFVEKYFAVGSTIRYKDLKPMIVDMGTGEMDPPPDADDRLRMLILFFLASVMKAHTKTGERSPSVDPVLLRAVSDLKFCRTFPWGRYSYDYMLEGISNTMSHFDGVVPESEKQNQPWPIPGFVLPLELLAFEAIPQLDATFREPYPADEGCPKMCKSKFKRSDMKGIPFERISAELGTTKDIDNFIPADASEKRLLARIMEKENDVDRHCPVVESWMKLAGEGKVTFLKDMFDEDVARLADAPQNAANAEVATDEPPINTNTPNSALVDLIESMKKEMEERMTRIENKVDRNDQRIAPLEAFVKEHSAYMRKSRSLEGDGIDGEDNREREGEPIVNEKGSEERVGDQSGLNMSEGLGDPPQVMTEDVADGSRDPSQVMGVEDPPHVSVEKEGGTSGASVQVEEEPLKEKEASTVVPPVVEKRTRFKQCSKKSVASKRQRDAINKKFKERRLKKQKQEEATGQARMSTRLAEKEKL